MKKSLSVLIAILMVTCLSTTVFAATVGPEAGNTSTDVKGTYVTGGTASTVYSVNVAWGSMEFTYNDASPGTWNPDTHAYDGAGEASWTCEANANKITVTNHSNTAVSAGLTYSKGSGFDGISGDFSTATIALPTAVGKVTTDPALTGSSLLTLSGALASGTTAKTVIGSITVTIT